jgi:hypothetical protein
LKKAIPYLLLFGLLYGAWFYWQQRPKPPLRALLLPHQVKDIDRLSIAPAGGGNFELLRIESGWVAESEARSIAARVAVIDSLLRRLLAVKSDGLARRTDDSPPVLRVLLSGPNVSEDLSFYEERDSLNRKTRLLQLNGLSDYYRLTDFDPATLPLNFSDFRNHQLLNLSDFGPVDSLVWWRSKDSTRLRLLDRYRQRDTTQRKALDSLRLQWSPKTEQRFAHFFAEIRDETTLLGHYWLFAPERDSLRLSVFYDDRWPLPFVLKSTGPEYFAVEQLPFPLDSVSAGF